MFRGSKIISIVVLVSFLLNTAVYDTGITAQPLRGGIQAKLSPPSMLDDLTGIEHKDMGRIRIALQANLANLMKKGVDKVGNIKAKEDTIFHPADMQFFFNESRHLGNGHLRVMTRIWDQFSTDPRTYYAIFKLGERDELEGIPIHIYTKREYQKFQDDLESGRMVVENVPDRAAEKKEDEDAIEKYVQHERNVDTFFAGKMEKEDAHYVFTEEMKNEMLVEGMLPVLGKGLGLKNAGEIIESMKARKLIFVRAKEEELPEIDMADAGGEMRRVKVSAHTSGSAVWIVLNDLEWTAFQAIKGHLERHASFGEREMKEFRKLMGKPEKMREHMRQWRESAKPLGEVETKILHDKIFGLLIHEVGVICGLPGRAQRQYGEVYSAVNELDVLFQLVSRPDKRNRAEKDALMEALSDIAPVDLDRNLKKRDYAAGFTRDEKDRSDLHPGMNPENVLTVIAASPFLEKKLEKEGYFTFSDYLTACKEVRNIFRFEALYKYPDDIARDDLNVLVERGLLEVDKHKRPYRYRMSEEGKEIIRSQRRSLRKQFQVARNLWKLLSRSEKSLQVLFVNRGHIKLDDVMIFYDKDRVKLGLPHLDRKEKLIYLLKGINILCDVSPNLGGPPYLERKAVGEEFVYAFSSRGTQEISRIHEKTARECIEKLSKGDNQQIQLNILGRFARNYRVYATMEGFPVLVLAHSGLLKYSGQNREIHRKILEISAEKLTFLSAEMRDIARDALRYDSARSEAQEKREKRTYSDEEIQGAVNAAMVETLNDLAGEVLKNHLSLADFKKFLNQIDTLIVKVFADSFGESSSGKKYYESPTGYMDTSGKVVKAVLERLAVEDGEPSSDAEVIEEEEADGELEVRHVWNGELAYLRKNPSLLTKEILERARDVLQGIMTPELFESFLLQAITPELVDEIAHRVVYTMDEMSFFKANEGLFAITAETARAVREKLKEAKFQRVREMAGRLEKKDDSDENMKELIKITGGGTKGMEEAILEEDIGEVAKLVAAHAALLKYSTHDPLGHQEALILAVAHTLAPNTMYIEYAGQNANDVALEALGWLESLRGVTGIDKLAPSGQTPEAEEKAKECARSLADNKDREKSIGALLDILKDKDASVLAKTVAHKALLENSYMHAKDSINFLMSVYMFVQEKETDEAWQLAREALNGLREKRYRDEKGRFTQHPGKSWRGALRVIAHSYLHDKESFNIEAFLEAYGDKWEALDFEEKAPNAESTARRDLNALKKRGLLEINGWQDIRLTPEGRDRVKEERKPLVILPKDLVAPDIGAAAEPFKKEKTEHFVAKKKKSKLEERAERVGLPYGSGKKAVRKAEKALRKRARAVNLAADSSLKEVEEAEARMRRELQQQEKAEKEKAEREARQASEKAAREKEEKEEAEREAAAAREKEEKEARAARVKEEREAREAREKAERDKAQKEKSVKPAEEKPVEQRLLRFGSVPGKSNAQEEEEDGVSSLKALLSVYSDEEFGMKDPVKEAELHYLLMNMGDESEDHSQRIIDLYKEAGTERDKDKIRYFILAQSMGPEAAEEWMREKWGRAKGPSSNTRPGKSPKDAFKLIRSSMPLQQAVTDKGYFTLPEYLDAYRELYSKLDFDELAPNPETTARDDLEDLEAIGILEIDRSHKKYRYRITPFGFSEIDCARTGNMTVFSLDQKLFPHIKVFGTEDQMGKAAAQAILRDIRETVRSRGRAVMLFASAPSQHATWKWLLSFWAEMSADERTYLADRIVAFHMDEYIGLPENAEQLFGKVLRERVFGKLGIPERNIHYFDDRAAYDTAVELRAAIDAGDARKAAELDKKVEAEVRGHMNDLLRTFSDYGGVFDIVIGGIGKLPHLAFNDPPEAKFDDPETVKLVKLTETSRQQQVDDGEFEKTSDVPTHALTFSLTPIISGRRIHIMVPREFKAESVRRSLDLPISEKNPASGLRLPRVLPNVSIYLDEAAASKSKVALKAKSRDLGSDGKLPEAVPGKAEDLMRYFSGFDKVTAATAVEMFNGFLDSFARGRADAGRVREVSDKVKASIIETFAGQDGKAGEKVEEMTQAVQLIADQAVTIISWIERDVPGAKGMRLTAEEAEMVTSPKGLSYIDARTVPKKAGITQEEGTPGLFWRGIETTKKLGKGVCRYLIQDLKRFKAANSAVVMYLMDHGFLPVHAWMKKATKNGRISTIHETAFVNDMLEGSLQTTSTGPGHFQGKKLDIKHVTEGKGIQFNVKYDAEGKIVEVLAQEVKAGDACLALPGYVDYMVNLGGLRFNDVSVEVDYQKAAAFNEGLTEELFAGFDGSFKPDNAPYLAMKPEGRAALTRHMIEAPDIRWMPAFDIFKKKSLLQQYSAITSEANLQMLLGRAAAAFKEGRAADTHSDMPVLEFEAAGQAGLEIPTHPDKRYMLLMTSEFFANGELAEHQALYGDRFDLDDISAETDQQFVDKALAKAKGVEERTIVLVSDKMSADKLRALTDAKIRFIRTNTDKLLEARADKKPERNRFQQDTYVTMLLARCVNRETGPDSSIYRLLRFYLKTRFHLDAVSAEEYISALITGDIALLIKGLLSYRPMDPYDVPEYEKVAATLISA